MLRTTDYKPKTKKKKPAHTNPSIRHSHFEDAGTNTFFSYFLWNISNVEVFDVQLPQTGELTKLCRKLPDSRITDSRETTLVRLVIYTHIYIHMYTYINVYVYIDIRDRTQWATESPCESPNI